MKRFHSLLAALLLAFATPLIAAPVNLNTADAKTLETLNGIGPAKAAAIVEYRTKNGPFKSVDDLAKVPGIGDATVKKNRESLSVGAAKPAK